MKKFDHLYDTIVEHLTGNVLVFPVSMEEGITCNEKN